MTKNHRLYIYMLSLLYPAVLGTLLYGILTTKVGGYTHWAVIGLMAVYFILQFAEKLLKSEKIYGWGDLVFDLLEVAAMIAIFAALGFFTAGSAWVDFILARREAALWLAMLAVFALPPVARILLGRHDDQHELLAMLSLTACFGCVFALLGSQQPELGDTAIWVGLAVIALPLGLYIRSFRKLAT